MPLQKAMIRCSELAKRLVSIRYDLAFDKMNLLVFPCAWQCTAVKLRFSHSFRAKLSYTFWNDLVFGGHPSHVTFSHVCLQAKAGARTLASSLMDVRLLEQWRVFQLAKYENMMEPPKPLSCTEESLFCRCDSRPRLKCMLT